MGEPFAEHGGVGGGGGGGGRATLINDIHWRFRADNSAIHQIGSNDPFGSCAPAWAKSIKVIDCGSSQRGSLTSALSLSHARISLPHGAIRAGVGARRSPQACVHAGTNSRDNASPRSGLENTSSGNVALMRIAWIPPRRSERDVCSYVLSKHVANPGNVVSIGTALSRFGKNRERETTTRAMPLNCRLSSVAVYLVTHRPI